MPWTPTCSGRKVFFKTCLKHPYSLAGIRVFLVLSVAGIWLHENKQRTASWPNGLCSGCYQSHRYNMLSKSTVVALCSLLVYVNFISALDILMKALLVCCIDLVFKLAPLQWYSYFKFAFSMYSYIGSNYMWPHEESRKN